MSFQFDIMKKMEDCVVAASWITPETIVHDSPEIYKVTNRAVPFSFLNGIYRSQLPENEIDKSISDLMQSYKNENINFRWFTYLHSRPQNLDKKLALLNPTRVIEMFGLYADIAKLSLITPKEISVEPLSLENIDDYILADEEGWGLKGVEAQTIAEQIKKSFNSSKSKTVSFLARYDGAPAGCGSFHIVDSAAYLVGTCVRPKFRERGVYRGLLAYRLKEIQKKNINLALTLARINSSAPICRKLGFEMAGESNCYEF
jgi:N-acetylglutamate synthase-like GNAT family acetyltransferase